MFCTIIVFRTCKTKIAETFRIDFWNQPYVRNHHQNFLKHKLLPKTKRAVSCRTQYKTMSLNLSALPNITTLLATLSKFVFKQEPRFYEAQKPLQVLSDFYFAKQVIYYIKKINRYTINNSLVACKKARWSIDSLVRKQCLT